MPGLATTPDESGLKPPSGGAVHSPGIYARAKVGSLKTFLIRRRPVKRRNGNVVEAQVDGELAPVMGEMIEGAVADRDVSRLLGDDVAAGEHFPGRHQVLVGG